MYKPKATNTSMKTILVLMGVLVLLFAVKEISQIVVGSYEEQERAVIRAAREPINQPVKNEEPDIFSKQNQRTKETN